MFLNQKGNEHAWASTLYRRAFALYNSVPPATSPLTKVYKGGTGMHYLEYVPSDRVQVQQPWLKSGQVIINKSRKKSITKQRHAQH